MSAPAIQRTELLDALRGFALFGVVYSNYAGLSYWFLMEPADKAALPGSFLDVPLEFFHTVFIDGKFYSIFSLLFGIGFGFFLGKGSDGLPRFYRRMFILLVIGWLHLRYLWEGDILFLYAVLGMLLPLFRKVGDRALLIVAAVLLLAPIGIDAVKVATAGAFDPAAGVRAMAEASDRELGVPLNEVNTMVPKGGIREFIAYQDGAYLWRFTDLLNSNRIFKVPAMFLLGLWVSRRKLFVDPAAHRKLLRRACIGGFAIGLPGSLLLWWSGEHLAFLPRSEGLVGTAAYSFGVAPLAIGYAAGFALFWTKANGQRAFHVFAPMGRMALTNYLMQTIIGISLFAGLGLGLGNRVSAIGFESIAVGVFLMELAWSHWWLKRFRFGPMEWVWRSVTYGSVMPMRVQGGYGPK